MKRSESTNASVKLYSLILLFTTYFIIFFLYFKYITAEGLVISKVEISQNNIWDKIFQDFILQFSFLIILALFYLNSLRYLRINKKSQLLIFILGIIYLLLYFLHGDFSLFGKYQFVHYLVGVAFTEELLFRGIFYGQLKPHSIITAVIISGLYFGAMHAIVPSILANATLIEFALTCLSELGGGVLSAVLFVYLLEKSETLWVPILIHAISDYSVGYTGAIVTILCCVYLASTSKNKILIKEGTSKH